MLCTFFVCCCILLLHQHQYAANHEIANFLKKCQNDCWKWSLEVNTEYSKVDWLKPSFIWCCTILQHLHQYAASSNVYHKMLVIKQMKVKNWHLLLHNLSAFKKMQQKVHCILSPSLYCFIALTFPCLVLLTFLALFSMVLKCAFLV